MHPSVQCSTIYNSQDVEETHMSINRGLDKDASEYGESSMETPPHAEQMANPLCHSGSSTQGSATTWRGRGGAGGGWDVAPVYPRLIHADVRQKPTQRCKAVLLQLKINLKKEEWSTAAELRANCGWKCEGLNFTRASLGRPKQVNDSVST